VSKKSGDQFKHHVLVVTHCLDPCQYILMKLFCYLLIFPIHLFYLDFPIEILNVYLAFPVVLLVLLCYTYLFGNLVNSTSKQMLVTKIKIFFNTCFSTFLLAWKFYESVFTILRNLKFYCYLNKNKHFFNNFALLYGIMFC
jgi:hypothetical protein